jgi:hypothetical protein
VRSFHFSNNTIYAFVETHKIAGGLKDASSEPSAFNRRHSVAGNFVKFVEIAPDDDFSVWLDVRRRECPSLDARLKSRVSSARRSFYRQTENSYP